jgi:hypothetical protein
MQAVLGMNHSRFMQYLRAPLFLTKSSRFTLRHLEFEDNEWSQSVPVTSVARYQHFTAELSLSYQIILKKLSKVFGTSKKLS